MYYQYFGLNEAPFSIAVNPRYLFMSARHRDALAHLLYVVGAGGGLILLTGEVGTGKTTINRCLLEQLPHDTDIAIILNPALDALELLATACDELGIEHDADNRSLKSLTDKLHTFLLENYGRGRKTVLMIDEAQHLDFEVLEQIRLLTNLETNEEKLLQIILIGQPELAQMLARPELRQLNQRITARYNLEPLNLAETGAYIRHRLQVAGMTADREIFPSSVVRGIYRETRGIPRLINLLCDRMLLGAYGRNRARVDRALLRLAVQEVMGEERTDGGQWRWSWVAAALLVLGLGGWWIDWQEAGPAALEEPPAQVSSRVSPAAATAPESISPAFASREPATAAASRSPPPVATPLSSWLLPPAEASALLWSLYSPEPVPADPCPEAVIAGVACVQADASTWEALYQLDRPLLLEMITPDRFSAAVLLLGVEGRQAWVSTGKSTLRVNLGDLGPHWSGGYRFLWHPPEGYQNPLSLGDSGAVVESVAQLFARLDDQPRALAGMTFNEALRERVRLFQRHEGLDDDGVVGVQTLLKLNERLGIDLTARAARGGAGGDGEVVPP